MAQNVQALAIIIFGAIIACAMCFTLESEKLAQSLPIPSALIGVGLAEWRRKP